MLCRRAAAWRENGREALPGCTGQEKWRWRVCYSSPAYHNTGSERLCGNWLDLAHSNFVVTAQSESQARAVLCKPSE